MSHPFRVAVIGAGPAGLYACQALLDAEREVSIDLVERQPTPYGLIRYGVAPDHPKIKSVADALVPVLEHPAVRFLGNVAVGSDIDLAELRSHYDVVLFTTGAQRYRLLDVPGEMLPGCQPAGEFVAWYNGDPDAAAEFPLDARHAVVVGAGNVALDAARMLARHADDLTTSDVPTHVLDALRDNKITDVYVVARRGPAQAKFTSVELREMDRLVGVDLRVDSSDLELDPDSAEIVASDRQAQRNLGFLQEWAERPATDAPRRVHFCFWRRPVEVTGDTGATAVTGVRLAHAPPTGAASEELIECQTVLTAIGYHGAPVDGLPFDARSGTVPNERGQVVDDDGAGYPGVYVAGWIKRGPTGVIGANKSDANETVETLLERTDPRTDLDSASVTDLLDERGVEYVDWQDWIRLDTHELDEGTRLGRPRVKVSDRADMLRICHPRLSE